MSTSPVNLKIGLTYPHYNSSYYQKMLYALSLELKRLGFESFVCPASSRYVGMCDIVISINSNRKHHRHIKSSSRFLLWLQDCPYNYFRKLSRSRSCLKHRDVLLCAAPEHFGFDWTRLIDRGIRISSLFYAYCPSTDAGVASIYAKHSASSLADSPSIASLADGSQNASCGQYLHPDQPFKGDKVSSLGLCSPIITLGGFYDKDLATLLYGASPSITFPHLWALAYYYSNLAKLYPPFEGALANNKVHNHSRNPLLSSFFNIFFLSSMNSISRIIERTLLADALLALFEAPQMQRHLLLVGGVSQTISTTDIFRLPKQKYSEYNNLICETHAVICNNTHGLGLHPRVLDAMVSGTVVLHHLSPRASGIGVLEHHFQPGVHFLGWTNVNELMQLLEDIVSGKYDLCKIALSAYERVRENHSWFSLASQLVTYFDNE